MTPAIYRRRCDTSKRMCHGCFSATNHKEVLLGLDNCWAKLCVSPYRTDALETLERQSKLQRQRAEPSYRTLFPRLPTPDSTGPSNPCHTEHRGSSCKICNISDLYLNLLRNEKVRGELHPASGSDNIRLSSANLNCCCTFSTNLISNIQPAQKSQRKWCSLSKKKVIGATRFLRPTKNN